jgi:hypothetical protein
LITTISLVYKPFKTKRKPILKNVVANWYNEISLEILKENSIKSIRIEPHLDISIVYPWA